jgi:O-antigen ligase
MTRAGDPRPKLKNPSPPSVAAASRRADRFPAIDAIVFYALLCVIALAAIPYGAAEPWWQAFFECSIFLLAAMAVVGALVRIKRDCLPAAPDGCDEAPGPMTGAGEGARAPSVRFAPAPMKGAGEGARAPNRRFALGSLPVSARDSSSGLRPIVLPIFALMVFAFAQTIPWSHSTQAGINIPETISADPFQTREFIIQILALLLCGCLLVVHATTRRRLLSLVQTVIVIGVASALFGLVRQVGQHQVGFLLPFLRPGFGYGQFINSNHFAYLMEMALGLTVGLGVFGGGARRRALYLLAALPMWIALVLANSRAGIVSMLCQLVFLAVMFFSRSSETQRESVSRARLLGLRAGLVALLLLAAVVTVFLVGGDPLAGRLDRLSVELDRKTADSYTLRPNIWRATVKLIKEHPVAGVGFGGYRIAIAQYHHGTGDTTPRQAHSDYLELLASGGVIALVIGVWFVFALVQAARRPVRNRHALARAARIGALAGLIAVAVHSLVDFGLHLPGIALVFTCLLAIVLISSGELRDDLTP